MASERRNLFRSSLVIEPLWKRFALAALALSLYAAAFLPLYARAGVGISALSLFPVVVLGWLFGAWGGLLGGILSVPLNALLLTVAGEPGWSMVVGSVGGEGSALVVVVGAVVGLLRDLGVRLDRHLTEWRKAEIALRETEDRYRLLFEHSRDPMFVSRPEEGIVDVNDALQRLFERQKSSLLQVEITDLFTEDDDRERYRQELERSGFVEDMPVRLDIGSEIVDALVTASARFDANRRVVELQGSIRDVSDNRTLHALAERRTRELESALRELESFTYSVSHDLRTHLVTMGGFASMLWTEHRDDLPEAAQGYLERVVRASGRMDAFVQDLLHYSRVARAEIQPRRIELRAVVSEAQSALEAVIADREASIYIAEGLGAVEADRHLLERIVENLLSNALKFVPPSRAPEIEIRSHTEGRRLILEVEDNGVGIEEESIPRVFDAFERLEPGAFAGTGVGLTIVQRAVERMGGEVGVRSRRGEGSTFWIELPLALPRELQESAGD